MPHPNTIKPAKYATLAELSAAFKSGELDAGYCVVMDKGGNSLSLRQSGPEESEQAREAHCASLFRWEYDCPMQELMALAGIPAEWC